MIEIGCSSEQKAALDVCGANLAFAQLRTLINNQGHSA
jgi:hypothetical protein